MVVLGDEGEVPQSIVPFCVFLTASPFTVGCGAAIRKVSKGSGQGNPQFSKVRAHGNLNDRQPPAGLG